MEDQREVVAFLSRGESYGKPDLAVERHETHISVVFLVDDRAYKLKRAIRFSYLDYSSIALREKHCRAELELNRRTAASLYLRVVPVTRNAKGRLVLGGDGAVVDWVLEMRRFAQDELFDRMAEAGKLTPALMRVLTDGIVAFHSKAEVTPNFGGRAGLERTIAGNSKNLLAACPPLDRQQAQRLDAASTTRLAALGGLLDARRLHGKVRRCHGDLHLRNICLFEGRPTPFDCIDFNDEMSCIDVLYDMAFLLMDLTERHLNDFASVVFNRHLDLTADLDGLPALPLFMSVRAAVRAHVLAAQHAQSSSIETLNAARAYLDLAVALLQAHPPCLVAIGGLSGTGKSTLAQALAPRFAQAPGARVIRSDVLRKRLFDVAPETKLPPSAYGRDTTERVYAAIREQAAAALSAGFAAIADAAFLDERERRDIAAVAENAGVPFVGLWLDAAEEVLARRLDTRTGDASDADTRVLRMQLALDRGKIDWHRIDAGAGRGACLAAVQALLAVLDLGFRTPPK